MSHRNPRYSPVRRGYERRVSRSPSPRWYRRSRGSSAPKSLLVRNIRRDCTPGDLRAAFREFGKIRDIYLPRDYYTGEPRGFGFVEYFDPDDAADAKYHMDRQIIFGREITVVFAEDSRKRPEEMRMKQRGRLGFSPERSRYYGRSRSRSFSRSRSRDRSVSRERNGKRYSRSYSYDRERDEKRDSRSVSRSKSRSRSYSRSRSPVSSDSRGR
eukprot:TRINITY_DN4717_c0_g2_i1.p1 TRINITY_DN4717_c0_g2~~TRINITY_DN4717_c0_g2_i1.p1  ORF type:complete len:213 (-),score=3.96 TRINITY_DN4717_c0_g2_i1:169-807(-)